VTGGYCLALVFSYPLMLFPALRVVEDAALPRILRLLGGGGGGAGGFLPVPATEVDGGDSVAGGTAGGLQSV
jgi:hypothetical protein